MEKQEAFLITEEILRTIKSSNHFPEQMYEYICDKLDISDETFEDVLHIISEESEKEKVQEK